MRATEDYWRTLMVDNVMADDDKVALVYKHEERATMCTSIVKEITDFVHKSFEGKIPSSRREDFSKDLKASYQEQVCMMKLYCFEGAPDSSDSRFFLIRATKMEHPFYI